MTKANIKKKTTSKKFTTVASAKVSNTRIAPLKLRLVVDMVRGKQLEPAFASLKFSPKKGAKIIERLLFSALSNAKEQNPAVDASSLWVTSAQVGMGQTIKRFMPRARGTALPIRKRSSHVTVELGLVA